MMSIDPASPGCAICVVDSDSEAVEPRVPWTVHLLGSVIGSTVTGVWPIATLTVAVIPPAVALTVARPYPLAAAVNRPLESTVPNAAGLTDHTADAAGRTTGVPSRVVAVSLNCWVPPLMRSGWVGDRASEESASTTFSVTCECAEPACTRSWPSPLRCPAVSVVGATAARWGGSTLTTGWSAAGLPAASVAYENRGTVDPVRIDIGWPLLTTAVVAGPGWASVL